MGKRIAAVAALLTTLLHLASAAEAMGFRRKPPPPPPPPPSRDDAASLVRAAIPPMLRVGEEADVVVVLRNDGRSAWTYPDFKLGAVGDGSGDAARFAAGGDPNRVWLPAGAAVAPGQSQEFRFRIRAPQRAGTYRPSWQMVHEGVRWFGAVALQGITVWRPAGPRAVDPGTLDRKLLMGYQGWFACRGDGSPVNRWVHWFRGQSPDATSLTVDFWPDTSELEQDELFDTLMTRPDGSAAPLYSAFKRETVVRHFKWMEERDLDGVWVQRFTSELRDPAFLAQRNAVLANCRAGAEAHGRVFAVMYDVSGHDPATVVDDIKRDWAYLVDTLRVTDSPRYLRHGGRPALAVWGFGFRDRPGTPAQAQALIDWLRGGAPDRQRVTLLGGVPTYWRTLSNDSQSDPAWAGVYRSFDVISPWSVGRYGDDAGADRFARDLIGPDLAEARRAGRLYVPVVFPGFSWKNLLGGPSNQIPRRGGAFYWRQVHNAVQAGCTMLFGAMFDEVDEGTAMYKLAPTRAEMPAQATLVPLDADGQRLPSDWYLRLAEEAGKVLRGDAPNSPRVPIAPP